MSSISHTGHTGHLVPITSHKRRKSDRPERTETDIPKQKEAEEDYGYDKAIERKKQKGGAEPHTPLQPLPTPRNQTKPMTEKMRMGRDPGGRAGTRTRDQTDRREGRAPQPHHADGWLVVSGVL